MEAAGGGEDPPVGPLVMEMGGDPGLSPSSPVPPQNAGAPPEEENGGAPVLGSAREIGGGHPEGEGGAQGTPPAGAGPRGLPGHATKTLPGSPGRGALGGSPPAPPPPAAPPEPSENVVNGGRKVAPPGRVWP